METIGVGSKGPAVEDIQRRLAKLGYDLGEHGVDGSFKGDTAQAIREFRRDRGLPEGDTIDAVTWAALVDSSYSLGDRTLYLRMPYFHGNDVAELQQILNILGFAAGPQDAIFGAFTERAVREFQTNMGIEPDGIVGMATTKALSRLHRAWNDKRPIPADDPGVGFSRAAEVIESTPVCVYGVDDVSRRIAARISNLAFATSSASKLVSADRLSGVPADDMLMVQIDASGDDAVEGSPTVVYETARELNKRLANAVALLEPGSRRVVIHENVPDEFSGETGEAARARYIQHAAVLILDAICNAFLK